MVQSQPCITHLRRRQTCHVSYPLNLEDERCLPTCQRNLSDLICLDLEQHPEQKTARQCRHKALLDTTYGRAVPRSSFTETPTRLWAPTSYELLQPCSQARILACPPNRIARTRTSGGEAPGSRMSAKQSSQAFGSGGRHSPEANPKD